MKIDIFKTHPNMCTRAAAKASPIVMQLFNATALFASVLLISSCQKEDPGIDTGNAINILASVSGTATKASTAVTDPLYAPAAGAKLFLYYTNVGNAIPKEVSTFTYTTGAAAADGAWAAEPVIFWDDLAAPAGEYPFFAVAPTVPSATPSVNTAQNVIANYTTSDQLVAYTVATDERSALPLTFKHVLSQLKVTLSPADVDGLDIAGATLAIGGAKPAYTLKYDGATTSVPAVATVTGDAATNMAPYQTGGSFYAIIPAQTFEVNALTLTIVIKEKTYTWTNANAFTSVAGMNTKIDLAMQKTGVVLAPEGITLTDWGTIMGVGSTVVVDGLSDETAATGGITPLDGDVLLLQEDVEDVDAQKATYTYGASAWTAIPPIYWDNLPTTASKFKALYTPKADGPTGFEKDYYIGTDEDVQFGAPINLKMTHAMSQISINVISDHTELVTAISDRKIKINHLGGITVDGATAGEAGEATFTDKTSYIVTPQVFTDKAIIVLTSTEGHVYTLKLSDLSIDGVSLTEFVAGKSYALTVDLTATDAKLSVELKSWDNEIVDTKAVEIDNLTGDNVETDDVDVETGDVLKLWRVATPILSNQTATYTYDATTKWAATPPIYWGNLPNEVSTFNALFTPFKTVADNEKDYYIGKAEGVQFGAPINLKMTHAMAQINVVLVAGTGYEDASFLNELTGRTINLEGLAVNGITDNGDITLDGSVNSITAAAFTNKTAYIVAPQTLTAVNSKEKTIQLTTATNGHFYTVKLSDLIVKGNKLTELTAGNSYTITLTINDKAVSISTALDPWTDLETEGKTVDIDNLNLDGTGLDPTTGVTLIAGDNLYIKGGTAAGQSASYAYDASNAWTATAPIYWGNMPTGASTFDALFTPVTKSVHNEKDYLIGKAKDVKFGAPINLKMTHAMAKITVKLIPGTGFGGAFDDKLTSAFINLKPLETITLDGGVTLKASNASVTGTDNFDIKGSVSYIVAPQLAEGAEINVTLKEGHIYTVPFTQALVAGNHYTINITLNDTEASMGMTLIDWAEVPNVDKAVTIDDIGTGAGSGTFTPQASDQLKLWATTATGNKITYTRNTTAWTATPPLYWGDIPKADNYTFNALYTPNAVPVGGEKSYLIGATKPLGLGDAINLNMTHAMARIKVVLKNGTGYESEDALITALTGRVINLKGLKSIADDGTVTLENAPESITTDPFANDTYYIVAPQELTAANTIVLTLATGHKYTLDLSSILSDGLNVAKSYKVTVTVNDTAASIGVTLEDWAVDTEAEGEAS